jgi:hypothetical protein
MGMTIDQSRKYRISPSRILRSCGGGLRQISRRTNKIKRAVFPRYGRARERLDVGLIAFVPTASQIPNVVENA